MTEEEWLKNDSRSRLMLTGLMSLGKVTRTKIGKRKLRLYACGGCRLIWEHLRDERLRDVVEVAERFADGQASKFELDAARTLADGTLRGSYPPEEEAVENIVIGLAHATTAPKPGSAAFMITAYPMELVIKPARKANFILREVLRCIFGNPFRPVEIDPRWLTSNVVDLAQAIYQERAFERMPILADALMDAGCDSEEIIQHCRGDGPHVRGCWVVDLLLGKV